MASEIPDSYLGCYIDTGIRDLPVLAMVIGDLTADRCASECWSRVSMVGMES